MAKISLFGKMAEAYPNLAKMSANRFSKLTRNELYNIAKAVKESDEARYLKYFFRYNSMTTPDLAQSAFNWASNKFLKEK